MALTGTGGAHYLHLRCFLEGIEVPVIGASVTSQLNAPATAMVQIVPSDVLATLLPRTTIHLFYLDSVSFSARESGNPNDHDYKLLFCGEVFDTTIAKSGHGSRTASLRCMDFSNVWDTNYSYIMRYAVEAQESQEGGAIIKNVSGFVGGGGSLDGSASPNPFDDIVNSPADVIARMATASGAGNPGAPGNGTVLGGLLAVLELLSGIQGLYIGINPWATVHERRCRVMDSLASDNGTTAKSLFDQQVFADWLQQKTGTAASVISFRQIINLILGYIYYDVVTNLTPAYFAGDNGKGLPGRNAPTYTVTPGGESSDSGEEAQSLEDAANLLPVDRSKIAGLDSNFWTYCTEVLKSLSDSLEGVTYAHGTDSIKGKPVKFMVTSGHRNLAQQQALNNDKSSDGQGATASKGAHTQGFAIDVAAVGIGRTGTMPYMLNTRSGKDEQFGKEIPADSAVSHSCSRFRKAIWMIENSTENASNTSPTITTFEGLLTAIKGNEKVLTGCFKESGADETTNLNKYAATVQNAADFWKKFKAAIKSVNATTNTGISGEWGGDWKSVRDPLWTLFGMGYDPVHIQDSQWRKKTASTLGGFAPPTEVRAVMGKGQSREKLKSFIFRPNIWFAAPPLCNVLLPHMYESVSVSRQMMRETTRLQLDAFNQFFESNVLNTFYYAPQFQNADGSTATNHVEGEGMGSVTKTIIMDHEVYSGIIPKMERISEISFYAKQSGQGTELRVADGGEVEASAAQATIVDYGERVAHYNLLTHRYSARTASVGGPFNPYLVCGFPAAIVDEIPYVPSGEGASVLKSVVEGERLSTKVHWLGLIESLSHTYDQSGARTSAQLRYVRSHRTGDNTDDLLSESVTDQGVFKIQDANYSPSSPASSATWSVSSVKTQSSEITDETDDAWVFQYLAKTLGVKTLPEIISKCTTVVLFDPEVESYDPLVAFAPAENGSADFSKEKISADSEIKSPTGTKITEAAWSGAETWAVLQFSISTAMDLAAFNAFPPKGELVSINAMVLSRATDLFKYLKDIEERKALASWEKWIQTEEKTNYGLIQVNVPVLLPGDTLTISYEGSQGSVAGSRDLPIEEAIRPPFIDKGVYTNAPSDTEGYAKIDLLYRTLFSSPSVIHSLLLAGATPYDGMNIHSVEQAVDYIVTSAGIQTEGDSQRSYATSVTSRPIASLPDILAPKGWVPTLLEDGTYRWEMQVSPLTGEPNTAEGDIQLTGGFHSNAVTGRHFGLHGTSEVGEVGPNLKFGSMLEFLDLDSTLGSRLKPDAKVTLGEDTSIRLDPRAPRASRVMEYVQDIGGNSALRKLDFGSVGFKRTPSGIGDKG